MMRVLQKLAYDWGIRAFGVAHISNSRIRALRLVEEAIEAAQACGVEKEKIHTAVEVVYSRPPGNIFQEIGGVMITTLVLAETRHANAEELAFMELQRVLNKPIEHFARRNEEKLNLGLD